MTKMLVPIVSPWGVLQDEREYVDTPFSVLYPNDPLIAVQWLYEGRKKPLARQIEQERDCLCQSIHYQGVEYNGAWGWGSAVKKGETIGLTHDIGWQTGMMRYVEDGQRFTRWLLAQGWYGIEYRKYRIRLVTPGTMTKWGPVADGFGYFARPSLNNRQPIKLGRSKGSYTFWQRIPFTAVLWEELRPLIDERLADIAQSAATMLSAGQSLDYKVKLVDIDPEMVEHPFVANMITSHWAEFLMRVATTVPIRSMYRLAVPAYPDIETVESGDPGGTRMIVCRYPIDSYGNIQACETTYSERIAEMEAIQYSISSYDVFFKGCGAVIDEPKLDGYDAILCTEDLKMSSDGVKAICLNGEWEGQVVLSVTQRFSKGSCIGVNPDWFKLRFGGDNDGDGVEVVLADGLDELYTTVKCLPYGESPKLPKVKRILKDGDYRPEMIEQSMQNLVGFASNVTSQVLAKENQESQALLLGFPDAAHLHARLNYAIKVGTDGFKTNIDPSATIAMLTSIQGRLAADEINPAPWTGWSGTDAFGHYIPEVYDRLYAENNAYWGERSGVKFELDDEHFNTSVSKDYHTGTVGRLCAYILPQLVGMLGTGIKVQPLQYFRRWGQANQLLLPYVRQLRNWWNIHRIRCNWSDPGEISQLKMEFSEKVKELLEKEQINPWETANTFWVLAHSARGIDNQAASVFFAFPEECLGIVLLKPGDLPQFKTTLTGLDYQLPNFFSGRLDVEVVDVDIVTHGLHRLRKALIAQVEGQKQPQPIYPRNMIALVSIDANQPAVGHYTADILKTFAHGWRCVLSS
jgi:hypothetical protein